MTTPKKKAITRAQRTKLLAHYEDLQDTRPGQMLVEDLVALDRFGAATARIGVTPEGTAAVVAGSEQIADEVERALGRTQTIRVITIPRVTRQRLEALEVEEDE